MNRQGFDEVVLTQIDAAYRLALWRLTDEHDAEAAVEQAAWRALRRPRTPGSTSDRAWFLKIVSEVCNRWPAGTSRTRVLVPAATGAADRMSIDRAIRSLPDRLREVLVLRELEGLSYAELAEVIGEPISTVAALISRARQTLNVTLTRSAIAV